MAGFVVVALAVAAGPNLLAEDDDYRVYTEHPRLILTSQRLRLLKRERERDSQRWRQFDLLVKGGASLPEPGFALALYYAISGDNATGKRAVEWALGEKIGNLVANPAGAALPARRDRVLALIATADDPRHSEEGPLGEVAQK